MATSPTDFRELRAAASGMFKPAKVRLLLVAEAPPCSQDRYFYFESVKTHDWLFRYVCAGLFGEMPRREDKPDFLRRMKEAGVFLIDLSQEPLGDRPSAAVLRACVPEIAARCSALAPGAIILIKSCVYDLCHPVLADAGLPVVSERIPFPASGQQHKFEQSFGRALASIAWSSLPPAGRRK